MSKVEREKTGRKERKKGNKIIKEEHRDCRLGIANTTHTKCIYWWKTLTVTQTQIVIVNFYNLQLQFLNSTLMEVLLIPKPIFEAIL